MSEEKIKKAVEQILNEHSTDLCIELIQDEGINSPDFARAAFEANIFYPNIIYCNASEDVRDKIIGILDEDKPENNNSMLVNGCLMALAAIGDDVVAHYFKKWDKSAMNWKNAIHVSPVRYAEEGGWCIEKDKKKKLYFDECYALEKVSECEPNENIYGGMDNEKCPKCGYRLADFIVNGSDSRLSFLGISGRIKTKVCLDCLPYEEAMYCEYEEDGESKLIYDGNIDESSSFSDDEEDEDIDLKPLVISKKKVPKNYCDEFMRNAIGGMSCFIDDAVYMNCPKCGNKMKHLMQLGGDYTGYGTIYFQICTECKVTAAVYQQS